MHFQCESGSGNLASTPEDVIRANLTAALTSCPEVEACAACFAGLLTSSDRFRAISYLEAIVKADKIDAYPDYYAALYADPTADLIIIAGTGSLVASKTPQGVVKSGGGGPLLGDEGSTFDIGRRALVSQILRATRESASDLFWEEVANQFGSVEANPVIASVYHSPMPAARLAKLVPAVAVDFNRGFTYAVQAVSDSLGDLVETVANHLFEYHDGSTVEIRLAGGLWDIDDLFYEHFSMLLNKKMEQEHQRCEPVIRKLESKPIEGAVFFSEAIVDMSTESRNPRSIGLDKMAAREIVRLMNEEEQTVLRALQSAEAEIAIAIEKAAQAFQSNGRIIYVGAGTSGRVAAMDAAEMPPTFGIESESFVAVVAGGDAAKGQAVEDAEDNEHAAVVALNDLKLYPKDIVIGLAASGRTPFVIAACRHARQKGAWTCGIANNKNAPLFAHCDHSILLETGPEVLTGSTRLKAGTAQKLVLNRISTGAMVLSGKVIENLMVDVQAKNQKLRERCVRILRELAPVTESEAIASLEQANWNIREAVGLLKSGTRTGS
ncbi:N-acetylmuramic acid 6-phosphate etherase [Kamptonema cortianum]|nr:N-acetylmuramic acid 6-phosphate etherase [Kamptonema cortianum]